MKEVEDMMPTFADYKIEIEELKTTLEGKELMLTEVRAAHVELLDLIEKKHAEITQLTEMKQMLIEENSHKELQLRVFYENTLLPKFMEVLLQRKDPKEAYVDACEACDLLKDRPEPKELFKWMPEKFIVREVTQPKRKKNGSSKNEVT